MTTYTYRGHVLGMPSALLALGWIALWLAWPARPRLGAAAPEPRAVSVARVLRAPNAPQLYLDPSIIGRPSPFGFSVVDDAEPAPEAVRYERAGCATFLPWTPGDGASADDGGSENFGAARMALGELRPAAVAMPPCKGAAVSPHVRVEVLGSAHSFRLQVGDWPTTISACTNGTWLVVLFVQADEEGMPTQIFIEESSGSHERDRAVMNLVRRGRVDPGGPWAGRVAVGCTP